MKARIVRPAVPAGVLVYGMAPEMEERLRAILEERGLPMRRVAPEECGQTVGHLAGCSGYAAGPKEDARGEETPLPCMVMGGLAERQLDDLLAAMRRAGVEVPLKAVVTAHNIGWRFADLLRELRREREKFGGGFIPAGSPVATTHKSD